MAVITGAEKVKKETVTLTVSFEYEIVNGEFQSAEDEAHYNKYAEYIAKEPEVAGE